MARTVVIGGSGFIGSRLIPALEPLGPVLNLDKTPSNDFPGITRIVDVRDRPSFAGLFESTDTIVLLAAEHRDDVVHASLYYDVNVEGMRAVLAEMEQCGVRRIVFTSTVAVYGLDNPNEPREDDLPIPTNHYGASKRQAEELLDAWVARGDGRSALILRPSVVFGENNRGNVFNLVKQIYTGRFVMIGDGRNHKSMSYVGNFVAFTVFMLQRGWSGLEIFNYADKPDLDMNALVAHVYRFRGRDAPRLYVPYPIGICVGALFDLAAKVSGYSFSISSIRIRKFRSTTQIDTSKVEKLGFKAPFSLLHGLQSMLVDEFGDQAASISPLKGKAP